MALMASRSTETVPSGRASLWKVTLRMMRLTLAVGMRTESAMKPIAAISGMTCSSAAAALVDVMTTLPSAPRLLRRSVAPALGTASSTGCELVTACTVLIPAVIMLRVRSRSSSGRIMWASAVVVHDAAETSLCSGGVELVVVDAVDEHGRVVGQADALAAALERRALHDDPRPGDEVAAERSSGASGSASGSRNVPVHSTTSDTPWSRQGMSLRVARLAQDDELLAVSADQAALLIDHADVGTPDLPVQEAVQGAVRACPWRCTARLTPATFPPVGRR